MKHNDDRNGDHDGDHSPDHDDKVGERADGTMVLVRIEQGVLAGRCRRGVIRFDAVPYAAAPVGPLRWRAPQPAPPWRGERDASRPGPVAPQPVSQLAHVMGGFERPQSEDCLHLTIWTPACDRARRPVLVWLHGGGFGCGGGALDWYDGERLAREGDVVVVSIHHRLGALGYLHLPELPAANVGLLDIEAALQWVQRQAESFGGDPAQVTAAGQSAGALAAALLLARWPRGTAPFARAILQSAPLGLALPDRALAGEIGRRFLHHVGEAVPAGGDRLDRLQRLPLAQVLRAQRQVTAWLAGECPPGEPVPDFGPWPDGQVLPEAQSIEAALDAAAGAVDVLIGATRDEMTAFASPERMQADWGRAALSEAVLEGQRGATQAERFTSYLGERIFRRPVARWAEHAAAAGRRAFVYSFDWAPRGNALGATHGIELPFVFGSRAAFGAAPLLAGAAPREVYRLSALVRRAWLGFVRDGRPGAAAGLPAWPSVSAARRPVLHLDRVCVLSVVVAS